MGIDIYLRWPNMSDAEEKAQLCGFDVTKGHTGYLREAYHGGPYATEILVPEAFAAGEKPHVCSENCHDDNHDYSVPIPAALMRERLEETMFTARERDLKVYGGDKKAQDKVALSFQRFVELAEKKEAENGEPCRVYASY